MSISPRTRLSQTDKSFPKKNFCKGIQSCFEILLSSFGTKFLSIYNSPLAADMDCKKYGQKLAYFFMEKQKRKKTAEKQVLCKSTLNRRMIVRCRSVELRRRYSKQGLFYSFLVTFEIRDDLTLTLTLKLKSGLLLLLANKGTS